MSRALNMIVNDDLRNSKDDPDYIYLNCSMINNDFNSYAPKALIFTDLRNAPILDNANEYYLSVSKFHIDTWGMLPVIIPQIQIGQSDPNLTIYSFTMKYKTHIAQAYLEYVPDDESQTIPLPPLTYQDLTSQYYFCKSYQYFISLCNDTLKAAFTSLTTLAGSDTLPTTNPPFILFDPTSSDCIISGDAAGYDVKNLENPIEIYLNCPMYNLYAGFECINKGYNQPNGMNMKLNIYNDNNLNTMTLPTYTAIQSYQQFSSISNWSPIQSIFMTSSMIPVTETITTQPIQFNSPTSLNNSTQNSTYPILTDFSVFLTNGNEYFPCVDYSATGTNMKLIHMTSHSSIKNIQISVFWCDIYSNTHQLYLNTGAKASLTLCFRKKSI